MNQGPPAPGEHQVGPQIILHKKIISLLLKN